jgi:glycosyltransferase involved in cell wall biosynthesis
MKITIITNTFHSIPPHAIGAVEKRWYDVGVLLSEQGHQVTFISKRVDVKKREQGNLSVRYIKGYNPKKNKLSHIFVGILYALKALLIMPKADVLVILSFWAPFLCLLFPWKYKVSVYNVFRFPKGQFKYYKHIDRLSCVSSAVYDEILKQTPSCIRQAKVIPNPVNTSVFKYCEEPTYKNKIIISYAGRVHPEKGLDILVKSFDILKQEITNIDIELRIIGSRNNKEFGGGTSYVSVLEDCSNYKIQFIDPIYDPDKLWREISKCNIFCYPSVAEKGESFGIAPLEAMATGRATVVSSLECFLEFVQDGKNALVFNHRENAIGNLTDVLRKLIHDSNLRKNIGEQASITALQFSTQKIANLYLEDFKFLLNRP